MYPKALTGNLRSCRKPSDGPMPGHQVGIAPAAGLEDAGSGRVVDVREAEAGRIAIGPLEVVHQAPGEVPGQRHALLHRTSTGSQVTFQEGRALRVVHGEVPVRVIHEGRAVLGDVDLLGPRPS